jgi:hypothetical protein
MRTYKEIEKRKFKNQNIGEAPHTYIMYDNEDIIARNTQPLSPF